MKIKQLLFLTLISIIIFSCQTPEKQASKVVDDFFNEIYNNGADKFNGSLKKSREVMNYSYVSSEMEELIENNFIGLPDKGTYKLTTEKKPDNTIIITSVGKSPGVLGRVLDTRHQFLVSKINGAWKIVDSYNLIGFNIDFRVVDTQWENYWDIKKSVILKEVMDNIKLEIVEKGYRPFYGGETVKGKLRLTNNSDYDIEGIDVIIEHFDKDGISVNTGETGVYDIIRSKGYREFNWYSSNCSKCVKQTFKIKFVEETIK